MIIQKKKRYVAFICSLLLFLSSAACKLVDSKSNKPHDATGATVEPEPVTKTESLLGTVCKITIYDKTNEDIFDKAFDKIREIENKMSTSISDSEVSKINAKSGQKFVKISIDRQLFYTKANVMKLNTRSLPISRKL
ncbi:FAD:protein FMN transferase [Clostridium thermarum]|uniref:FAD:protein FMN transferase n=1 Tax=Clostridium thermarum TaxID=1716543 RepID=UPI0013D2BB8B|nr:FAD:protein FMN transferase [Clostridium thermarum]